MLSFRMILFCGLAGICLWGLFDLLENLKQPELLRSSKAILVKGCEPVPADEAGKLCPQLYCQKALLETKAVPLRSRFSITVDKTQVDSVPGSAGTHLVAGLARLRDGSSQTFACVLYGHKVTASRAITPQLLEELAQQSGDWKL
jgi:hypothetical protein